jgi:hypothetical protein
VSVQMPREIRTMPTRSVICTSTSRVMRQRTPQKYLNRRVPSGCLSAAMAAASLTRGNLQGPVECAPRRCAIRGVRATWIRRNDRTFQRTNDLWYNHRITRPADGFRAIRSHRFLARRQYERQASGAEGSHRA